MIKDNISTSIFFLFCSIFLIFYFLGFDKILFNNIEWLYGSGDLTNAQLSWEYFFNDIWRFPLGKNPNYGLEISNSIVFTDNIPLLAIFFKILSLSFTEKFINISPL